MLQEESVIAQSFSCGRLCYPLEWRKTGFPILYHLLDLAQTHVHWVGDVLQPLCPLSSLSSPALSLSQHQSFFFFFFPQHQSLFSWVSTSHQVAKVFELQLQHQSSNAYSVLISFRIEWFDLSLLFKGLSSIFSNAIVQKNHYFGSQSSLWSKSHIHMQLLEKP